METVDENSLTYKIIGAAIEVHKTLGGPGLLESVYEKALCQELLLRNIPFQKQVFINIVYKGVKIKNPLCLDILVDKRIIIELKATEKMLPIHDAQLLTYLRLTGINLGLIINFGQLSVKDGVNRIYNNKIMQNV